MEYEMKSICQKFTDMLYHNILQNECVESHVCIFEPLKSSPKYFF